jgi:hypothetical protein
MSIVLKFCLPGTGFAGPPLATDDPGILDPGAWEVITALTIESRQNEDRVNAPLLDISLGLGAESQLSVSMPYSVLRWDQETNWSGPGDMTLGYKWRFLQSGGFELATAVNYSTPMDRNVEVDGTRIPDEYSVPLLLAWAGETWSWMGQLAWTRTTDGESAWDFGVAAQRQLGESTVLMVEIYGDTKSIVGDASLNLQLGIDHRIFRNWHILTAIGSGITRASDRTEKLDYCMFLGVQTFL